ncbi:hypothetical protein B0H14DRAFT_3661290 [Mycena olivaceomarginata]|nr:hypothetical protein B0H14DRAFT_3661290 [Mycena olivaceomarginata]
MTSEITISPAFEALGLSEPDGYTSDPLSDLTELEDDDSEDNDNSKSTAPAGDRKDGGTPDNQKSERKAKRNRDARVRNRAHKKRKKAEKAKELEEVQKKTLAIIYSCNPDEIHIHNLRRNQATLKKLQDREQLKKCPLSRADIDELIPEFKWMCEPGIHLGFVFRKDQHPLLVLAVKISAWGGFHPAAQTEVQGTLQDIMDWGELLYEIKNNVAAKGPSGEHDNPPLSPKGKMVGIGWHLSQEPGKTLVAYAFKDKTVEGQKKAKELISRLPKLAALFRHRLSCLFPGGVGMLQAFADERGVLSFGDILDGDHVERPFANSLTATREGFSNFQHMDNDASLIAYGMWFEAGKQEDDQTWSFTEDGDHEKTKGGEFIWGAFGIGLVEIFWRGKLDFHGTLESMDDEDYTRFGTSIQITAKGVNAMEKLWNVKQLAESGHNIHNLHPQSASRITTQNNRTESTSKASASQKRKNEEKPFSIKQAQESF